MYSLLLYLYQACVFIASFFSEKVKKMWRGEQAAFHILEEKADPESEYLWFHAASLGEFEQARPIIENIKKERPEEKILVTFFSPSGYEVRKNYEHADIVCYLPLDTPTNAYRFLKRINIKKAYFIKYEFWWNYLRFLRRKDVPTYSVSSIFRKEQIFFKWYNCKYNLVLKCFSHFFVQNEVSKQLLAKLGITDVTVTGDTRFDRVKQIQQQAKVLPIVEEFLNCPPPMGELEGVGKVFVAGSSWQPDEDIFLRYFAEHKDWKLIIAPHVIGEDHLNEIESKLAKYGMKAQYYNQDKSRARISEPQSQGKSQGQSQSQENRVLIINCFGLLSSIYRYGTVAYVGGGFGVGIHNVLEAAVWGVPVFFGPNNKRFQEAQDLIASGGGLEINSYEEFAQKMDALAASTEDMQQRSKASADYVASKCGATQKILELTK
ncbi:MAG: 3-deoxy-D-manno-octulosonic acid transferase [Bacteroidaceae bacterium]|nr:3-deoxy-D-manno-octulosonic acid transferase [Bacteroidaceae bacterium]